MIKLKELAVEVKDPLFRKELNNLVDAIDLAKEFKRIDMAFLQMINQNSNLPKFAILPYELYLKERMCYFNNFSYEWDEANGRSMANFKELFSQTNWINQASCCPSKKVPESIQAKIENEKQKFDKIFVAWEAEWNPVQQDPIVIGNKGKFYFIIATWDLTKLESYIVSEF